MYQALLFTNNFFCLSSACLSNKPKTKAQAWLLYKQMKMNELFIELSLNCLWTAWFVYSLIYLRLAFWFVSFNLLFSFVFIIMNLMLLILLSIISTLITYLEIYIYTHFIMLLTPVIRICSNYNFTWLNPSIIIYCL